MTQVWHTVDSRTGLTSLKISQFIGRHKKAAVTRLVWGAYFPWKWRLTGPINGSQRLTQATVTLVALSANRSSNHWVTLLASHNCYISTKYLTMWFRFSWLILWISQLTCFFHPNCHYILSQFSPVSYPTVLFIWNPILDRCDFAQLQTDRWLHGPVGGPGGALLIRFCSPPSGNR